MRLSNLPIGQVKTSLRCLRATRQGVLGLILILLGSLVLFKILGIPKASALAGEKPKIQMPVATLSERVSVRAAGRGNPWINLSDGRVVLSEYSGPEELCQVLEQNQAAPLSICSGDFDNDGVVDLIGSYAGPDGGIITLHRGNAYSIYPNSPEAKQRKAEGTFTESPFLSPAHVFSLPEGADFIRGGDFDADGHWDVVAARRGGDRLYLLKGDGRGGFDTVDGVVLNGRVTALVTGEVNRADGSTDLVVAVSSTKGAKLLLYEGPQGALRADPQVFDLSEEVSSLALGNLDDDCFIDVVAAAGRNLVEIRGRDRRLSLDKFERSTVKTAIQEIQVMPFELRSLIAGHFTGGNTEDIVALGGDSRVYLLTRGLSWKPRLIKAASRSESAQLGKARISSRAPDNVLLIEGAGKQIEVLDISSNVGSTPGTKTHNSIGKGVLTQVATEAEIAAVLPVSLNPTALNDLVVLQSNTVRPSVAAILPQATRPVTNNLDSGVGSFRQAIIDSNIAPGMDIITFNIPGSQVPTIELFSQLPLLTDAVLIDGTSQTAGRVELDGSGIDALLVGASVLESNANGLVVNASNCTIQGMVINRFNGSGINISLATSNNNIVRRCLIGTDPTGTIKQANRLAGVAVSGRDNLIGGTQSSDRNVISGNGDGIAFLDTATRNRAQGNYVGVDATGAGPLGNTGVGIYVNGTDNVVGGTEPGARNISSANIAGIVLDGRATLNRVQGNFLGIDPNGTMRLGNLGDNMHVPGFNNLIGGTTVAARNIIANSGNVGVSLYGNANQVQGNFIGTNLSGSEAMANEFRGIDISGNSNIVGGAAPGAGNLISGNLNIGVAILPDPPDPDRGNGNKIQGNLIGTNASGTARLGNQQDGVHVRGSSNEVGGTEAGTRNVVSGNGSVGIFVVSGNGNRVRGNFVGTDLTGTREVGNSGTGVAATSKTPNITIGGPTPEERNIISGNGEHGVALGILVDGQTGCIGTLVQSNYIGTDVTGTKRIPNIKEGMFVDVGSSDNTILNNVIAFNRQNGIRIPDNNNPGIRIEMLSNSIHSNGLLPIDLGPPGITNNDPKDPDEGANRLQNFPLIVSAMASGSNLNVSGNFNSAPNSKFKLQFYHAGSCQGCTGSETFCVAPAIIDTREVQTDANGDYRFQLQFQVPAGRSGGVVNCTATSLDRNTSEMSPPCIVLCTGVCQPMTVTATGTNGAVVTSYSSPTLAGNCEKARVSFSPPPGSTFPVGNTTVTCTITHESGNIATCSFTVTVSARRPIIANALREGKNLAVNGQNFDRGAVIIVNGNPQKTLYESSIKLSGKKLGKKIRSGDRVQVKNPDNSTSDEYIYSP